MRLEFPLRRPLRPSKRLPAPGRGNEKRRIASYHLLRNTARGGRTEVSHPRKSIALFPGSTGARVRRRRILPPYGFLTDAGGGPATPPPLLRLGAPKSCSTACCRPALVDLRRRNK